jgi:UDP-N-acetylglucosamine--N-acetylmuramyl-(pentapeptide) pyrophosphoryl-undecaprenol N-acetylglucosamine transferase
VPLPIGNGEQRINAEHAVAAGTSLLVADGELSSDWVAKQVPALFGEAGRIERMSVAAVSSGRNGAAGALVALVAAAYRARARRERPDS